MTSPKPTPPTKMAKRTLPNLPATLSQFGAQSGRFEEVSDLESVAPRFKELPVSFVAAGSFFFPA